MNKIFGVLLRIIGVIAILFSLIQTLFVGLAVNPVLANLMLIIILLMVISQIMIFFNNVPKETKNILGIFIFGAFVFMSSVFTSSIVSYHTSLINSYKTYEDKLDPGDLLYLTTIFRDDKLERKYEEKLKELDAEQAAFEAEYKLFQNN